MSDSPTAAPQAMILMGVSGSGKTVVGRELAKKMNWPFLDADDFHPQANVDKMRAGQALTDADRQPWLERIHEELRLRLATKQSIVLACSALKEDYRQVLRQALTGVTFFYLRVDREVLEKRLSERKGHFFPRSLLDSQLATLENPKDAVVVDENRPLPEVVQAIVAHLSGA